MDCSEEFQETGNDDPPNEYTSAAAPGQDGDYLGFDSPKPGHKDKDGNPIITVIDRSGVHEIGVIWCGCFEAPDRDMQLMMAGLFPATFRNPKTAFTFQALGDFHLDNLECKTTPSQFFSRLRRLTNDEFPNTVPVGCVTPFANRNLTANLGQISGPTESQPTVETAYLPKAIWFWV
jgi:hypothetical protein